MPASTIATPAISVSTSSAAGRSALLTFATAEPAASDAAVVVVMTIRRVLAERPPAIGPAKLAYSPWIGLTPARMPDAMPSGTLPIAPGRPATRSDLSSPRPGLRVRSQRTNQLLPARVGEPGAWSDMA